MSEITREVLARIEKALKESDDEFIVELREEYGDAVHELLYGINYDAGIEALPEYVPDLETVDVGHEGDGTEAYAVFKDKVTGTNVGFAGWYASHEGYDWNGYNLTEMEPFTVTHYRKKK